MNAYKEIKIMETWNSDKILDISRYYWQSSILHAAVKLDIFTVIG
jgi:hypothetical protein